MTDYKLTPGKKAFIREYIYSSYVIWPMRCKPVAEKLEAMGLVNCQHPPEGPDQFLATLTVEGKKVFEALWESPLPSCYCTRGE